MEYDGAWLATELSQVLDGWDIDLAHSVVAAIDLASTRTDVDDIIMVGNSGFLNLEDCKESAPFFSAHCVLLESGVVDA